jgi:hypothetical protein
VFVELYGSGHGITLNAEHKITDLFKGSLSARIGFGKHPSLSYSGGEYRGIPISVNYFSGKGKHHREVGIGLTYAEADRGERFWPGENKSLYVVPIFGYRFQKPSGGFVFKIQYCPHIIVKEYSDNPSYVKEKGEFFHGGGLSLGYYFSR